MKKILAAFILFVSSNSFAQAPASKFIHSQKKSCLVWDADYSPADSATWSGPCKNNYADGEGILVWYQNNIVVQQYSGQLKKGSPEGKGNYDFIGQGTMEGNFVNGLLQGQGKMAMANGSIIQGNFEKGELLDLDSFYLHQLKKITIAQKDSTDIYISRNDDGSLFYYALAPKTAIKAVLVLFPSTDESGESVISCNKKLMQQCYDNNVMTIVPSANYNKGLELDNAAMAFFNNTFKEVITKYKAPKDKFILCGLSLGGENALHYTEMSRSGLSLTSIRPLAVIGVDPPVDMIHLYNSAKQEIELYKKDSLTQSRKDALYEDNFLMDYFHKQYGGSPKDFPEKYIAGSEFTYGQKDGGNAKYLIDVPLRIYTDPDILWQLKNKSRDYYHMNAADQSAMINFLQLNGNTKAAFIPALGKGYRLDGTRHPHSWSIVDAEDCVKWILALL